MMSGNHRVCACVNGLRYRFVRSMRNIDHHSEPVHLGNKSFPARIQTMPTWGRAAAVGVPVLGVVGGKLIGTKTHVIETAQHSQIAITIQTSFHVEYRGYLPARYDAIDVPSAASQFDHPAVLFQLNQGEIHQTKCLFGLVVLWIVFLCDESEKKSAFTPPLRVRGRSNWPSGKRSPIVPP